MEQQRTAQTHTRLDKNVRLQREHHFLQPNQIFRKLQNRQSKPGKGVVIAKAPTNAKPIRDSILQTPLSSRVDVPELDCVPRPEALACRHLGLASS
jgi:hypothetical protein